MDPEPNYLSAGTGRRGINPPPNIAHGGWGAQKHEQAEGIDMDLWATALALSAPPVTCLLLDIDVQILTNEIAQRIRSAVSEATQVPIENIRASATHTHSGPVPYKSWIEKGHELVGPWFDDVCRWASEAAVEAVQNLQPVRIRAGRGECFINVNRRAVTPDGERILGSNPAGLVDHEVLVVGLDDLTGNAVATLVNYACHPTVMGPLNRLITPDYPGAMKRVVEQALGGRCLFLLGAAGDQGPVRSFQADVEVYRNFGALLGHEVAKVSLACRYIPVTQTLRDVLPSGAPLGIYDHELPSLPGLPLQIVDREIIVPLRKNLPEKGAAAKRLQEWKEKLKDARLKGAEAEMTKAIYEARRADIQLRMAEDFTGHSGVGVKTQFICFGDVALVSCNVEPFCGLGLVIKRTSPFLFTALSGYSNGRLAYLPTAEEWARGGYEVDNSPFDHQAAEIFQREVLQTLDTLRRNRE